MKRKQLMLVGSVWALLGVGLVAGCGDDSEDDATGGRGGTSQGTGGSKATGGKTGTGGTSTTGGSQGEAGSPDPGSSGAGGSGEPGSGGEAGGEEPGVGGEGGGGALPSAGVISKVADVMIEGVNDLRGLTYAQDGKIYGSGHIGADNTMVDRKLAVVRLNADGTLDDSFGKGGIVSFNLRERVEEEAPSGEGGAGGSGGAGSGVVVLNDGDEQSIGLVELANGDLVVSANVRSVEGGKGADVVLLRLNDEGELVESFGEDGIKRLDLGWTDADAADWTGMTPPADQSWGVELDPSADQEKVVVFAFGPAPKGAMTGDPAVQRTDNDRYVARILASDGSLDPDFNGGKIFSYNTGGTFGDNARRGLVEADGAIVSGGYTNYGEGLGNHIVLIRLLPDGTPDPAFGFGIASPGVARANPFVDDGGAAECYGVAKQKSGRYVTTGYGRATIANGSSSYGWETTDAVDLVAFGVKPDGIDTSFGREGTLAIQSEGLNLGNTEDRGRDLLALADDRVVFAGRLGPNPAIIVVTANGEPDATSGEDGVFTYDALTDPTSHFYRVVASPDGKRIATATNNHAEGVLVAVLEVGDE